MHWQSKTYWISYFKIAAFLPSVHGIVCTRDEQGNSQQCFVSKLFHVLRVTVVTRCDLPHHRKIATSLHLKGDLCFSLHAYSTPVHNMVSTAPFFSYYNCSFKHLTAVSLCPQWGLFMEDSKTLWCNPIIPPLCVCLQELTPSPELQVDLQTRL